MMRILKFTVLVLIALCCIAIWVVNKAFEGVNFGAAPGNPRSEGITQEEKQKMNQNTMTQLQANLEFVCKKEEKPALSAETQQLYNYALYMMKKPYLFA